MKKSISRKQSQQLNTPIDVLLGRASMIGFVLAFGAYLTTGAIAPGIIWDFVLN